MTATARSCARTPRWAAATWWSWCCGPRSTRARGHPPSAPSCPRRQKRHSGHRRVLHTSSKQAKNQVQDTIRYSQNVNVLQNTDERGTCCGLEPHTATAPPCRPRARPASRALAGCSRHASDRPPRSCHVPTVTSPTSLLPGCPGPRAPPPGTASPPQPLALRSLQSQTDRRPAPGVSCFPRP